MQNPAVLVVEDCLAQQLYAGQLLQQLKIQHISYASDGELALELLKQQRTDVMLIDLEMPQMNGVELLRSIAKQQLCQSVILTSAKDAMLINAVTTMAEADGLKVLGSLSKPVSRDLLELCLLRWQPEAALLYGCDQAAQLTPQQIRHAIEAQQYSLCYQPIVCAKTYRVLGFEALARWLQPDGTEVAPDVFISAAERFGLINPLSLQLLDQALATLKLWQNQAPASAQSRVQLCFNLSALSVSDQNYIQQLIEKVRQHGVAVELICWEITETQGFTELAAAIYGMARLRLNGFAVAIDDYGTGFANVQQLSRIPATRLKLDKSLVHKVSQRPQQRLLLQNTVQMTHKSGLSLVAEGVEHCADLRVLQQLGIEAVQGYLFSRPVSASESVGLLQTPMETGLE